MILQWSNVNSDKKALMNRNTDRNQWLFGPRLNSISGLIGKTATTYQNLVVKMLIDVINDRWRMYCKLSAVLILFHNTARLSPPKLCHRLDFESSHVPSHHLKRLCNSHATFVTLSQHQQTEINRDKATARVAGSSLSSSGRYPPPPPSPVQPPGVEGRAATGQPKQDCLQRRGCHGMGCGRDG